MANRSSSYKFENGLDIISNAFKRLEKTPQSELEKQASQYSTGYLALRSLIRDRIDLSDEQQLRAAGYAVYGWMPTILKKSDNLMPLSQFAIEVRPLQYAQSLPIVRQAAIQEKGRLLQSLNDSVVGTSKLLNFLVPHLFPIWDSRIAKLFGFKNEQHNRPTVYLAYLELLHQWCTFGEIVPNKLAQTLQADAPAHDPISTIRLIEYSLFLASVIEYGSKKSASDEETVS